MNYNNYQANEEKIDFSNEPDDGFYCPEYNSHLRLIMPVNPSSKDELNSYNTNKQIIQIKVINYVFMDDNN